MMVIIFFLAAACLLLGYMVYDGDRKGTKTLEENARLKERLAAAHDTRPLDEEGIMEAVRHGGYVPDLLDGCVRFRIQGEPFYVVTRHLPRIFVDRFYRVEPKQWDMETLRHAAHLLSDEMVMVKAFIRDEPDEDGGYELRFMVAAEDRTCAGFRDNILDYIGLIQDGSRRMTEIYEGLMAKRKEAGVPAKAFLPAEGQEGKVVS